VTAGGPADLEAFLREWDARLAAIRWRCLELPETEAARYQPHLQTLAAKLETLRARWNDRGLAPILPPEVVERIQAAKQDFEAAYAAAAPSLGPLLAR
jgi:hypothetical protein